MKPLKNTKMILTLNRQNLRWYPILVSFYHLPQISFFEIFLSEIVCDEPSVCLYVSLSVCLSLSLSLSLSLTLYLTQISFTKWGL